MTKRRGLDRAEALSGSFFCSLRSILAAACKYFLSQSKKTGAELLAIKKGLQALLRAQLIADYNKWGERGYAPIYARQNFENCWNQYHALGANGVMDDIHAKFLLLPTDPPETE